VKRASRESVSSVESTLARRDIDLLSCPGALISMFYGAGRARPNHARWVPAGAAGRRRVPHEGMKNSTAFPPSASSPVTPAPRSLEDAPAASGSDAPQDLLTVEQAAAHLQVSPSSIRSYIREGRLKAFRVAGLRKVLIPRAELLALLEPARRPRPADLPADG